MSNSKILDNLPKSFLGPGHPVIQKILYLQTYSSLIIILFPKSQNGQDLI